MGYKILQHAFGSRVRRSRGADSSRKVAGATLIFTAKLTPEPEVFAQEFDRIDPMCAAINYQPSLSRISFASAKLAQVIIRTSPR
jgi:hypothetical protein